MPGRARKDAVSRIREKRSRSQIFVGMDVAQAHRDMQVSGETSPWRVPHTAAGIAALCTCLAPALPSRIVREATGGLERPVVQALSEEGHAVARVHSRPVRDCGGDLGYRTQTDAIDAGLLAPCVGFVRARVLRAELPEPVPRSHRTRAALVGVAPFHRDRGPYRGRRTI